MKIVKTKVYSFDELSEEAKEKAIQDHYDINTDYEWYITGMIEEKAKEYGLVVNESEMCFDLDRGSYVYFDTHDHSRKNKVAIAIADLQKFLKKAGFDLRRTKHIESVGIVTQHFGGSSAKNFVECYETTTEEENKLQECLDNFLEETLEELKSDYEGLTDNESIAETLKINDYQFLPNGKMF